ncbi:Lon protease family protein [Poseidonibacter lekithochrous]|uniref:Lon protease family protein n=1 Tax=Poseidonibacter lekithochrous TaxID=1904463 RepID=UPI000D39314D|nr:AAA family ATPase [Poseidonibacter lekithochrous]
MIKLLKLNQLYTKCDTSIFKFRTTEQLKITNKILGQDRALNSIDTALGIKHEGYNLFIMGNSGVGKHSLLDKILKEKSKKDFVLHDWCYVNNFTEDTKPLVLKLPAGVGTRFKKDMQNLIKNLQEKIPQTFKQKEYITIRKNLEDKMKEDQDYLFYKLKDEAKKDDIFINDTTSGITISPLKDGKTLSAEEFQSLNITQREVIEKNIIFYKAKVDANSKLEMAFSKSFIEDMKEIDSGFIDDVVQKSMKVIKEKYKSYENVISYLDEVEDDVIENFEDFTIDENAGTENPMEALFAQNVDQSASFEIYNVNIIVNNTKQKTAPIVYEHNPTYSNLFGRIEHVNHMGTLTTDFNFIKAGALHRANGGYLVIDARALLFQPYSWEGLKRMLHSGEIHLETIEESMGLTNSVTLNPQSIELETKIILVGSRYIYYLLFDEDEDFKRLFKIEADFEDKTFRDNDAIISYGNIIASLIDKYSLLPLTKKALGRIVEFSSRLVNDSTSLSLDFSSIIDLLHESNLIAKRRKAKTIKNEDILEALDSRAKRSQRIKDEIYKEIKDETILIDTNGSKVGQINGLTVIDYGNFVFSMPVKISALTRVGKEGVVDIEREVDLSGAIHSKGVMILSSFLAARYSHDFSMSLSASLVFEQSYSPIDGDSASLAELYTLLSSISNIPIKQNFALTGSINQNGQVQAIGGVNEKIEGFYDVCKLKDENFNASVIIPFSNIKNLMLKEEVLNSVRKGQFRIYAIKHVDEGVKLLMDIDAGVRGASGKFPKNSLNYLVENRLIEFSELSLGKKISK